jgi:putative transposase
MKSLAVLSTGEIVPNPKHLEIALRELRRLQRRTARGAGPDRTGAPVETVGAVAPDSGSHRDAAYACGERAPRGLHQLTTRLVRTHGAIVLEDLNVAGMMRNRRLARHVAGVGMAETPAPSRIQGRGRDLNAARNLAGRLSRSAAARPPRVAGRR